MSPPGPRGETPPHDPVALQVLLGALASICEEMGALLVRAAHSTNIKERRDCSTAVFDSRGELVMQAEHIPVHLGSMPAAVAAVLEREHAPGRAWILNDPFAGGTHLPDITLISPVFVDGSLVGFAASRAHHADVGGPTPAGMPHDSRRLTDEGVVIAPTEATPERLFELASQMRGPEERLADLRAQRAANELAVERLAAVSAALGGPEALALGCEAILDYAERRARAAIAALEDGDSAATDVLEAADGSDLELRVLARKRGHELALDFSGSAGVVEGNLNCPAAVTRSAALFAVRALTDPDAPACAGGHRPVGIEIPAGTLLDAPPGSAVAAGNVETSSRVADLVIAALSGLVEAPAAGQGTMNNLTLSGEGFTYYETIGGGQGACASGPGASAVHVAMSNTLNTPVEALELELPVRVRELSIRRGSGGRGIHDGGEGIVRELEALAPMRYTLIAERRRHRPPGRRGGLAGAAGRDTLNGEQIAAKSSGELEPGDLLRIETPGGGGHGAPAEDALDEPSPGEAGGGRNPPPEPT